MKVIIAGSRLGVTYAEVAKAIILSGFEITEVVSGGAKGADEMGERWARANRIPVKRFPADWENLKTPGARIRRRLDGAFYNAQAGPDRNELMAQYAEALIALPVGKSVGTRDMIQRAKNHNLKLYIHEQGTKERHQEHHQ